jgi:hypothetical protein
MRNRAVRHAATTLRQVCEATLKVAATLTVFAVCVVFTMRYLGVEVPSAGQVWRDVTEIRIF